jgi:hypothetical protein
MTDDPRAPRAPRSPRSPDELASALLDGDLPPAEAESARRDPAVAARVAELAAARARLRDVPPPPAGTIDTAIAAALAAYDEDTPGATVTPLHPHPAEPEPRTPATPAGAGPAASPGTHPGQPAHPGQAPDSGQTPSPSPAPWAAKGTGEPARPPGPSPAAQPPGRSRSKAPRRVPAWLGAAALVAVLAGVVGLAAFGSRHQDADQSTAASGDSAQDSGAGSAEAAPKSSGGETLSSTTAPTAPGGELGDIGDYPSADALADRVLALVPPAALDQLAPEAAAGGDATSSRIAPAGCGDIPATVTGVDAVRVHGTARLDGAPVDVWLVTTGGKDRLVVVDATCAVVADRPLG